MTRCASAVVEELEAIDGVTGVAVVRLKEFGHRPDGIMESVERVKLEVDVADAALADAVVETIVREGRSGEGHVGTGACSSAAWTALSGSVTGWKGRTGCVRKQPADREALDGTVAGRRKRVPAVVRPVCVIAMTEETSRVS
ncbi:MAG: hypothetical protein U5R48_11340 [Gammaproteobacteria bacterium]|nr:hypothetical protein [Gammaproteobacteria bacterium]